MVWIEARRIRRDGRYARLYYNSERGMIDQALSRMASGSNRRGRSRAGQTGNPNPAWFQLPTSADELLFLHMRLDRYEWFFRAGARLVKKSVDEAEAAQDADKTGK